MTNWSPKALSILRIVTALLFLEHGTMKLVSFPAEMPGMEGLPPMMLAAGLIEIAGGVALALGLFTRLAAFICAGEMAVAYFLIHAPQSFWPVLNSGDAAILFCFVFLYFVFAGPGEWSLDKAMRPSTAGA